MADTERKRRRNCKLKLPAKKRTEIVAKVEESEQPGVVSIVGRGTVWLRKLDQEHVLASCCALCHIRIHDLFLVTTLRYATSDNFNYLHGCLTLLPSVFSWAPFPIQLKVFS